MDKVVYQNQNKGKLFKNDNNGSVQSELVATGNLFDAEQNKHKVALIKEVYNGDQNNARRYLYLRVGVAFANKSDKDNAPIYSGGFILPRNWNEPYVDPDDKMQVDSARARRRTEGDELRMAYFLNEDGVGLQVGRFTMGTSAVQNIRERDNPAPIDNQIKDDDIPF
jgi:hypothetical protein